MLAVVCLQVGLGAYMADMADRIKAGLATQAVQAEITVETKYVDGMVAKESSVQHDVPLSGVCRLPEPERD